MRGVWKSTDAGADWASAVNGLPDTLPPLVVRGLAAVPGAPGGIFAGTNQGLFLTSDGAATWSAGSADLAGKPIYCLAGDPAAATTLWAGTDDGVYRSTDSGQTWPRAGSPLGTVVRAILRPSDGSGRVLAATDAGLYSSGDGGATWRLVSGGLPAAAVNALAEDAASARVFAGTAAGVFESGDGGQTWTSSGGPANPNVLALAVLADGTVLAGTRGGSVYESAPAGAPRGAVVRPAAPPSPRALLPRD